MSACLEVGLGLPPLLGALVADAAEIEDQPVRLLRLGDGGDALAVDLRALVERLAPAQDVAERHDRVDVGRIVGDQLLQPLLGLVGAVERVEIDRELDLGVAPQRRIARHALVDLDRELRVLHLLVEVGERQQRERLVGREIERELQIDQAQVLAAAAAERGAEPVEHLGGAGLRRVDQRRQLLAVLDAFHRLDDQRMARQLGVEGLEHLERLVLLAVARQPRAIGLDQAQRGGVELVGALEALAGFLLVAGEIEDQAGVQVLEQRVPVGALQLVDRLDGGLGVARAVGRPGGEQRGGEIGDRSAHRLHQVLPRQPNSSSA